MKTKPIKHGDNLVTEARMAQLLADWARAADVQMAHKVAEAISAAEFRIRTQLRKEFNLPEPMTDEQRAEIYERLLRAGALTVPI